MLLSDEDYEKCGIDDIKFPKEKQWLLDRWREKNQEITELRAHIECLQADLEEAQKADFKINHDSDQIVIQRDAEPIDIAAALIHSDWINLGDLQEIAEHLQAAYKNSWGG